MTTVRVETLVHASPETCFDLARDVDAHVASTGRTRERAVAGVTTGMLNNGDTVTFEAVHFGVKQRLTSEIVEFDRPHFFIDQMVRGAFRRLRHEHRFEPHESGTLMVDVLEFESPFGPFGRLIDRLVLEAYMTRFIVARGLELKKLAETK